VRYGFGCLLTAAQLFLARRGLYRHARCPSALKNRLASPAGSAAAP